MEKFSERIYYCMHDDANDEPYLYYLKGDNFSLQVDAGNSPKSYLAFSNEQQQAGFKKPSLLILTHWHWDHSFGLPAVDIPCIATKKTQAYLENVMQWKWNEEAMKERVKTGEDIAFCYEKMHVEYPDVTTIRTRKADIVIDHPVTVDAGNMLCHLIPHDSPHTRDALFIYIPSEKVLIGGDGEYEDYYDYNSQYDPVRVRSFIEFIESLSFEYYLRGHDEVYLTKQQLLEKMNGAL